MIVITGATGFIGSVLAKTLNKNSKEELLLVDKFGNNGKWKNLLNIKLAGFADRDEFLGDLENKKYYYKNITAILHIGACSKTTEYNVDYLIKNNFEYSVRLCNWCVENGVRFIYASSAAVYGDGALGFSDSDDLTGKLQPLNPYGFSKWLFDQWMLSTGKTDNAAGLRFFNVFGPNEYHKEDMASVIYRYFPDVRDKKLLRLFKSYKKGITDGEQRRDFVYVKDVVSVIEFFLENEKLHGIYNLGSGKARSFNDVGKAMFAALGYKSNIEYFDMPQGLRDKYQYFTEADMSKLRNAGYKKPFTLLEEAVSDYIKTYLSKDNPYF
jgi:ADP-L-glycero-D-manno-heptose 6-epimerase